MQPESGRRHRRTTEEVTFLVNLRGFERGTPGTVADLAAVLEEGVAPGWAIPAPDAAVAACERRLREIEAWAKEQDPDSDVDAAAFEKARAAGRQLARAKGRSDAQD